MVSRIEAPQAERIAADISPYQEKVSEQQRLAETYTKTIAPIRQQYDAAVEKVTRRKRHWQDRYSGARLEQFLSADIEYQKAKSEVERFEAEMAAVAPPPTLEEYLGGLAPVFGIQEHYVLETAWTDPYTKKVYGAGEKISVGGYGQLTSRAEQYNVEQAATAAMAMAEADEQARIEAEKKEEARWTTIAEGKTAVVPKPDTFGVPSETELQKEMTKAVDAANLAIQPTETKKIIEPLFKTEPEIKVDIPESLISPKEEMLSPERFLDISKTLAAPVFEAEPAITPGVTGYLSAGKEKTIDIDVPLLGKVVIPAEPFFDFIGIEAEKALVGIHAKQQEIGKTLRSTMFQAGQWGYEQASSIVIGAPEVAASIVGGRPLDLPAARKKVFEKEFGGVLEPTPFIKKAQEAEWLTYKLEPITVPKKTGEEVYETGRMWAGTIGQLAPLVVPVFGTGYAAGLAITADNPVDALTTLAVGGVFGVTAKGAGAGSKWIKAAMTAKAGEGAGKAYRVGEVAVSQYLVPGYFAYEGVTAGVQLSETLATGDYEAFEKQSGELATGFGAFILGVKAGEKLIEPFAVRTTGKAVYRESLFEAPKEVAAQAKQLEVGLKRVQEYPHPVRELKIESERIPSELAKAIEKQIVIQKKELLVKGSQVAKPQMSKEVMARLGVDVDLVAKPRLGRSEIDIGRDFFKGVKESVSPKLAERLSIIEKPEGGITFTKITYRGEKTVEFSRYDHFTKLVAEVAGFTEPVSSFIVKTPKGVQMFELIGQAKRKARSGIFEEHRFEKDVADAMKTIESQKRIAEDVFGVKPIVTSRGKVKDWFKGDPLKPKHMDNLIFGRPTELKSIWTGRTMELEFHKLFLERGKKRGVILTRPEHKAIHAIAEGRMKGKETEFFKLFKERKKPLTRAERNKILGLEVKKIVSKKLRPMKIEVRTVKKTTPKTVEAGYKRMLKETGYKAPSYADVPSYKPGYLALPKYRFADVPYIKSPQRPAYTPTKASDTMPKYEAPYKAKYKPPAKMLGYPTAYKPIKMPDYPYKPITEPYKTGFDEIYKEDFYKTEDYPKDEAYKDEIYKTEDYPKDDFYREDTYPKDDVYKDDVYKDDYTTTRKRRDDLLLLPPSLMGKQPKMKEKPGQAYHAFVKRKHKPGKFVKVTKKPLTRFGALGRAAVVADQTIAQSISVRKAKGKPKSSPWDYTWNLLGGKFRPQRRKGKIAPKNLWIERRAYAIDTLGEKQDLTVGKFLAQERRASIGVYPKPKRATRKGRRKKKNTGSFLLGF